MNEKATCVKRTKNSPKQKKLHEYKIPKAFLSLMDELCIDRKNARMFFENPNEWSYIKSDRKIFCTKQGNSLVNSEDEYFINFQ